MAQNRDYVPYREGEFDGWLTHLTAYVEDKTVTGTWPHIPAQKVTELKQHTAAWHAGYAKVQGPHTSVDIEAKNNVHAETLRFVRAFVAQYLRFDPVTNEQRTAAGIPNRSTARKPIEKPKTRALLTDLRVLGGFQIEIRFQDEATPNRRARPYGMSGCLLNYAWGAEKVGEYAKLTQTQLMTHSPWVITLPPEAEGRFFSAALRWQTKRAELGPWCEIQHTVIA